MFDNKYNDFMAFYGDVCEDPRDPIERKLAVMKKGRNVAFGKSAPDPNPGMVASAQASEKVGMEQVKLAKESLDFYKQQYAEYKPMLDKVMSSELATNAANQQRADEYAAYERDTFRPLEKKLISEAEKYDTESKREELARQGIADVGQAFGAAREQQTRQLAAAGLRPNAGRFASLNNQMLTQEALAKAGIANQARTMANDKKTAMMYDAAGLGRGLATNASTAYGVSLNAAQGAKQSAMTGGQMMGQGYQTAGNLYGGATSSYGTAGNIYGQEFNSRMQGYNAQQEMIGGFAKGVGSIAGMAFGGPMGAAAAGAAGGVRRADGGEIRSALRLADGTHVGAGPVSGPGGPVDDKIPAMLSDGEYVIPADTVQKIGRDKLDKLVKATHTPAAVQRKRKALKGKK